MRYLSRDLSVLHQPPFYQEREVEGTIVEVALQYNESFTEHVFAFANTINTIDGGSHLTGFRSALTRVLNDYARRNKFLKEPDPNLSGEDVREGLTAVVNVKLPEPQFEGQTKTRLGNPEVKGQVESVVTEGLAEWVGEALPGSAADHREMPDLGPCPRSRPQGARLGGAQRCPGRLHAPRQTGRLHRTRSRQE